MEVEEDNIDPLVAPPLLAQPTPSLYYPPSLRLRFPTYAHLRPLETRETILARMLSYVLEEGPFQKGEIYEGHLYVSCVSRPILFVSVTFLTFAILLLCYSYIFSYRRERNRKLARRKRCRGHGGFRQVSRKSCEDHSACAREKDREKHHFIKNKFRKGVDGYPGASRGFDARRLASSFSLALPLHLAP